MLFESREQKIAFIHEINASGVTQTLKKGVRHERNQPKKKEREKKTRGYGAFPPAFQR